MRKYIILASCVFILIIGWFFFRQNFYIFLMYHGRGDWASARLSKIVPVDKSLLEKHLNSDLWFVRCSVIRTLRRMDDKFVALPMLERQISKEKDSFCRLELAGALMKHGQYSEAKAVLESLVDDSRVGERVRNLLKKYFSD